jgi:hypothetical protein
MIASLPSNRARAALVVLAFVMACFAGAPAHAQVRPGVDLRAGVAMPLDMNDFCCFPQGALERGTSFSLHLGFPAGPRAGMYLGFAQHTLECGLACTEASDLVSTSWVLGVRVEPILGPRLVSPWLKLGLLFDRTEADFPNGPLSERRTSSIALGPELGAGLSIRLAERVSLSPGARFVRVDASFRNGGDVLIKMIAADVGLSLAF